MMIIHRSLDLSVYDHMMLWAACCIRFSGFLQAGEFTVNAPFDPDIHLTVNDIQADSLSHPKSFRNHIECSKKELFCQGCYIYIGTGRQDLCHVRAPVHYLHLYSAAPGLLFLHAEGTPLSCQGLASSIRSIFTLVPRVFVPLDQRS